LKVVSTAIASTNAGGPGPSLITDEPALRWSTEKIGVLSEETCTWSGRHTLPWARCLRESAGDLRVAHQAGSHQIGGIDAATDWKQSEVKQSAALFQNRSLQPWFSLSVNWWQVKRKSLRQFLPKVLQIWA